MKPKALQILDSALRITESADKKPKKKPRLTELLHSPEAEETPDWYMCVPACFNEALDIRLTPRQQAGQQRMVWTQGSTFSFKQGDIIYDTPKAYLQWSEALKHLHLGVIIRLAVDSVPEKRNEGGDVISPRNHGQVSFTLHRPNAEKTRLIEYGEHELTQDDFVRFLIAGPDAALTKKLK